MVYDIVWYDIWYDI